MRSLCAKRRSIKSRAHKLCEQLGTVTQLGDECHRATPGRMVEDYPVEFDFITNEAGSRN